MKEGCFPPALPKKDNQETGFLRDFSLTVPVPTGDAIVAGQQPRVVMFLICMAAPAPWKVLPVYTFVIIATRRD
jgi:hypothetical protein